MLTLYRRPQSAPFHRDTFTQVMDRFFQDLGPAADPAAHTATPATPATPATSATRNWTPAMDLVETEDAFVATADLPGLAKEDITISLDEGALSISGERRVESRDTTAETKGFRRFERAHGNFHRAIHLPQGIDQENVAASFENGVLTLSLPKQEPSRSRTIAIA